MKTDFSTVELSPWIKVLCTFPVVQQIYFIKVSLFKKIRKVELLLELCYLKVANLAYMFVIDLHNLSCAETWMSDGHENTEPMILDIAVLKESH
jgi:hypothetical protein